MKHIIFILACCLLVTSCAKKIIIPKNFKYNEISAGEYKLACLQKVTDRKSPIRIYIEGDGNAFNGYGFPTDDPTPKGTFLRRIVFNDPNKNVVYLARPWQFIKDKDKKKNQTDWTTGRFRQKIINSTARAVKEIAKNNSVILIGYSGGALLSGLVIKQNSDIKIKKWITIAGVLNHTKWTEKLKLPPLKNSVDLNILPNVKQIHLAGQKDKIVPAELTKEIVKKENLIIVPKASHNKGFEDYLDVIYDNM